MKCQAGGSTRGNKIVSSNINNLKYTDDTTLMAKSEEELKIFLMKAKQDNEKFGLKLSIQKPKIMASGPITSWQIYGEKMETVRDYFLGLQNHRAGWLQLQNKKTLAPRKKSYDKSRQCIEKQRCHFADKVAYAQSYCFYRSHVQMWELDHKEGWVPKNWCLKLWCWRRLLRLPWTARRSNQSILKEISPEYSMEGLMLKLKLQYLGHLMWRANSLKKTLMVGKIEGRRRSGWQWMRWLNGISDSMDMCLSKLWEMVKDRETWRATVHGVTKSRTQLNSWATTYLDWFTRLLWLPV